MAAVTVSAKGQIVIPAELRRRLGIEPGCKLDFVQEGSTLRVYVRRRKTPTHLSAGYGMLVYRGEPRRLADFDVAEAMVRGREE